MVGDEKDFQRRELGLPGKTQNVQLNLNFRQTLSKCFCLSMPHATLTVFLFAKSGNPSDRKLLFCFLIFNALLLYQNLSMQSWL